MWLVSSPACEDVIWVTAAFQSFTNCFQNEDDLKQQPQNLKHFNIY